MTQRIPFSLFWLNRNLAFPMLLVFLPAVVVNAQDSDDRKLSHQECLSENGWLSGNWTDEADGPRGAWPSCRIHLKVNCSRLSVTLEDRAQGHDHQEGGANSNFVNVIVDDQPPRKLQLKPGQHSYEIMNETTAGEHTVTISKRTESNIGWIRFLGVTIDSDGKLLPCERPKQRLDFYGDSNSCGYGVENKSRDEHYSPTTQDSDKAFASIAAAELGMELRLVAASGWGILRGYGGDAENNIPSVHDLILIDDSDAGKASHESQPAAIVIVLGDNDFATGDPGKEFYDAYVKFVNQLREESPETPIFLCVSSSMSDWDAEKKVRSRVTETIDNVIQAMNKKAKTESNIFRVDIGLYQESEGYGADWHCSETAQKRIGHEIAIAVGKQLGN